jgi:hypothetical protein
MGRSPTKPLHRRAPLSVNDWFLKKQAQLLQDLVDAKAVTLELLENLSVLSKTFLQQATENHIDIPNREAVTHLVRRAEALLRASGETVETVLDGRPRDKLTPYPRGVGVHQYHNYCHVPSKPKAEPQATSVRNGALGG